MSWIFKSFCDATATHKIAILNSFSIGGLGNTHRLVSSSHLTTPVAALAVASVVAVLVAVAVASLNDLKIQLW